MFPYVNWLIILTNIFVFIYQSGLGYEYNYFIYEYGLVPVRVIKFNSFLPDVIVPFFSHMFLHGSFFHVFSNLYILFIFGDNIEDRLGHGTYFVMYILFGLLAGFCQFLFSYDSFLPMIGASGAVAGVMGAFLVFYPYAKVKTFVFIIIFVMFVDIPAIFYLLLWLLIQFVNGAVSIGYGSSGVAWWAHIGGFIVGMGCAIFFKLKEEHSVQ